MNIDDYLIDHKNFDWASLLSEWRFLLPDEFEVWLMTRTGDLFLELSDETIHFLDAGAATLEIFADDRDDFEVKIHDFDLTVNTSPRAKVLAYREHHEVFDVIRSAKHRKQFICVALARTEQCS